MMMMMTKTNMMVMMTTEGIGLFEIIERVMEDEMHEYFNNNKKKKDK